MKNWNKEVAQETNPQITIKITKEDVVDILSSAISGIYYWGKIVPNDRQYEKAKSGFAKMQNQIMTMEKSAMKRSSRRYSSMESQ